jgi:hypothetical protein
MSLTFRDVNVKAVTVCLLDNICLKIQQLNSQGASLSLEVKSELHGDALEVRKT